jgi:GAF domain-containing protein
MGQRVLGFFEEADRLGGLVAKMRLASLAQVTSTEAASREDGPDLVQRVEKALEQLRGEFGKEPQKSAVVGRIKAPAPGEDRTQVLRRHLDTYLDLMAQRSLFLGDVDATIRRVNEAASLALAVQRVSVWFCDATTSKITCADLFDRSTGGHSAGTELSSADFAPYFRALKAGRTIAANDANADPRTSCFSEVYLKPLGINSMLDVPIWVKERMTGVVCHEHVGPKRVWDADEETFAYLMSNFVALALERRR